MFKNYGPLATEVYELTKPVGSSLNGDIDYYSQRLAGISGKILEAGVGTGRMLLPLLEEGLTVEGLDQSAEMLAYCYQHLESHQLSTPLYKANLENFDLPADYEAIIMPTATFCLLETEALAIKVLQNLYHHLLPKGRLIIDLDLPFYPEVGEVITSTHALSETVGITLERKTVAIDWLAQHTITHLKYEKWQDGQLIGTELQQLLLRWYGLTEFRLLLEQVGFKDVSVSADYDYLVAPVDSNQTITFEAHK
ncbi:class I SAM-dependent methyltransferase [Vagococcus sp. BWB3-3]|uniref:Class I SAM-dependent methyltransferase n=1 Tax=Vagococcus allomyrinae TaxID=2794353 RepID=A0A940P796_9ENTE|nr:class I SAM-dependent methyltransferase [Vagococcus allomyrinae]MBP1042697.1 class I SAM-dependent methyltransferase [Vagococcus allomyrinae]